MTVAGAINSIIVVPSRSPNYRTRVSYQVRTIKSRFQPTMDKVLPEMLAFLSTYGPETRTVVLVPTEKKLPNVPL